jgi:hypothetical protein
MAMDEDGRACKACGIPEHSGTECDYAELWLQCVKYREALQSICNDACDNSSLIVSDYALNQALKLLGRKPI